MQIVQPNSSSIFVRLKEVIKSDHAQNSLQKTITEIRAEAKSEKNIAYNTQTVCKVALVAGLAFSLFIASWTLVNLSSSLIFLALITKIGTEAYEVQKAYELALATIYNLTEKLVDAKPQPRQKRRSRPKNKYATIHTVERDHQAKRREQIDTAVSHLLESAANNKQLNLSVIEKGDLLVSLKKKTERLNQSIFLVNFLFQTLPHTSFTYDAGQTTNT